MDRRRRKTREAIIRAFVRLFFEDGYEAVSMGRVAAAADVGRSTLYTHFGRKEELLCASMDQHLNILADAAHESGSELLDRLLAHFWENRRRRVIFNPGPCRDALSTALAGMIEERLTGQACKWRVPIGFAAGLIAEHELTLLDHLLSGQGMLPASAMAGLLQDSVGAFRASLRAD